VKFLAWHQRYTAHDDPACAVANLVAMVIAWNGPLYPLWIIGFVGWNGWPSVFTIVAAPFFFAVPWLMRRSSGLGRFAIPVFGTANCLWSTKLLGAETGVGLFLIPSLLMAALLYRRTERWLLLPALALPFGAHFLPPSVFGPTLFPLAAAAAATLNGLNSASVLALIFLLTWKWSGLLARLDP
jgi:hypothetical protein